MSISNRGTAFLTVLTYYSSYVNIYSMDNSNFEHTPFLNEPKPYPHIHIEDLDVPKTAGGDELISLRQQHEHVVYGDDAIALVELTDNPDAFFNTLELYGLSPFLNENSADFRNGYEDLEDTTVDQYYTYMDLLELQLSKNGYLLKPNHSVIATDLVDSDGKELQPIMIHSKQVHDTDTLLAMSSDLELDLNSTTKFLKAFVREVILTGDLNGETFSFMPNISEHEDDFETPDDSTDDETINDLEESLKLEFIDNRKLNVNQEDNGES